MTTLYVYADDDSKTPISTDTASDLIRADLAAVGVDYERWNLQVQLAPGISAEEIMATYEPMVAELKRRGGYSSADVISVSAEHPDRVALREKFLSEHIHSEDEVRFFVSGRGAFYLHVAGRVFALVCEQGDLLRIPAKMPHWFDMGPLPDLVVIRAFTNPDGWIAQFTQTDVAARFPRLDDHGVSLS